MTDQLNGTQMMRAVENENQWRLKVNRIIAGVRKESFIYFIIGATLYLSAGITCFIVIRDASMTALVLMGFFQLLVLFFSTLKIYPCIRGGFLVSVEQTCETIDDMRAIRREIERQGTPVPMKSRPVHEKA